MLLLSNDGVAQTACRSRRRTALPRDDTDRCCSHKGGSAPTRRSHHRIGWHARNVRFLSECHDRLHRYQPPELGGARVHSRPGYHRRLHARPFPRRRGCASRDRSRRTRRCQGKARAASAVPYRPRHAVSGAARRGRHRARLLRHRARCREALVRRDRPESRLRAGDGRSGAGADAGPVRSGVHDLGTICWLPDMARWAKIIASVLAPGGELYFADAHPAFNVLEDFEGRLAPDHDFQTPADQPLQFTNETTYTGDQTIMSHQSTREWIHPLSAVLGGLIDAGMTITMFREHEVLPWRGLPILVPASDRLWRLPDGHKRIPLSYWPSGAHAALGYDGRIDAAQARKTRVGRTRALDPGLETATGRGTDDLDASAARPADDFGICRRICRSSPGRGRNPWARPVARFSACHARNFRYYPCLSLFAAVRAVVRGHCQQSVVGNGSFGVATAGDANRLRTDGSRSGGDALPRGLGQASLAVRRRGPMVSKITNMPAACCS